VSSYSVHGLVAILVEDAPASVTKQICELFGPSHAPTASEPDILIRFADSFPRSSDLRYIGLNEAAFDGDAFFVLDDKGRRMRLPFERAGEAGLELVCERGMSAVPLLFHLVALRLLRKQHVVLHAAAFVHEGKGVLATGWRKGGKTELLLAFAARGAQFVSDEWTILSAEDGQLRGLPTTLGIWDWHFRYLPEYWAALSPSERGRLRLLRAYRSAYRIAVRGREGEGELARAFHRLSLETGFGLGQVRPPPELLFGDGIRRDAVPLDHVLFPTMADSLRVQPVEPADVARRMVASLAHERRPVVEAYERFRFAFPNRIVPALEEAGEAERRLLEQALGDRPAHEVSHPYPVSLPLLYDVTLPFLDAASDDAPARAATD